MSQEGIHFKILQRSSPISPVALGGEEALRPGYIELHSDFESYLLVADDGDRASIPRSIQFVAGRTGQKYTQRKGRKGAFGEDHATAVETDRHLLQCVVYIDLNMVRAGVVAHPSEWIFSGYCEIQEPATQVRFDRIRETSGINRVWLI